MERLDTFMARANAAYYATHDPFRDFTTSPEISQVFGEILGLWAAVVWEQIGRPDPVLLLEAGPGRGTLMADALRAIGRVAPAFGAALRVHLIEASPRLRDMQAEKLPGVTWHERLETVPGGPFVLLANEFLDALPIRQFVRREAGWAERFVEGGKFVERHLGRSRLSPPPPLAGLGHEADQGHSLGGRGEGAIVELGEAALTFAGAIGRRLSACPGAALLLDYGPEHSAAGESLQALRNGKPADPLSDPGSADLTAHVDFAAVAAEAHDAGADTYGPIPQGILLTRLGLFQRTDRLARSQFPASASALIEAARRLAEPDRMGRLFQVLAICRGGQPTPPGFE